eukprot:CAMPEP_0204026380 /NCGR_PEP_ID=MMETSP0360-20130528/45763_1 /ASSEMBLY_ACC=CAM_ASM_000342 /TAXON_ID=268821 /ORGANISM="Scrippsiella Hangoei, Strain SHTV-5" /LENGTH=52 /DNA_ID=CAMNT_0050970009 /DNA_START=60 /DNA_END=215 /DNA_ORIENTATION=+
MSKLVLLLALPLAASGLVITKELNIAQACVAEDLGNRAKVQNKLAGICEDMC